MRKCFIVQPFSDKYQKLYNDVYRSAIENAGIEPYKVDEDPSVNIPIENIEKQILSCSYVFADISEDNPNVWYELGYAMSANRGFCIVCAKQKRNQLPFDVRHRKVLFYDNDSPSDFIGLGKQITERFHSLEKEASSFDSIEKSVAIQTNNINLSKHELIVLSAIAAEQGENDNYAMTENVRLAVNRAGFTNLASALAVKRLQSEQLIVTLWGETDHGDRSRVCSLTEKGWYTLQENLDKLTLEHSRGERIGSYSGDLDDEIPF